MANITGTGNNDALSGTIDPDTITALGGSDSVLANDGNDTVFGGSGNDTLRGEGGDDSLLGETNNDSLYGGAGNDSLFGGDGSDRLFGNDGNDLLNGGAGTDTLDGGAGTDTADYTGTASGINVTLNAGNATISGGAGNDVLTSIENITGGSGADTITGDANANLLRGDAGNDNLSGGNGNDTIAGGAGNDTMAGGAGTDTADYSGATNGVTVNLTTGQASGEGADTLTSFENVSGSGFNDSITGNADANLIQGGEGHDTIDARLGNDSIYGGDGADLITGGAEAAATSPLAFTWSTYADEANLANPFTQSVGGIDVAVSYSGGVSGATFTAETSGSTSGGERDAPVYVAGTEPFNPNSSAELFRPADGGGPSSSSVTLNFSATPGAQMESTVTDVQFRVSDVDQSGFTDQVTVRAYDAQGNEIPVVITETSASLTVSGNTVTATGGAILPNDVAGSILYQIDGPVASVVISYTDLSNAQQAIRISDVHFSGVPTDADLVDGGLGADTISGGFGNDTLMGQDGNDSLFGGDGNDSLTGGTGNDTITGEAGNDILSGEAGDDLLTGGDGEDTFTGGSGSDTIFGGIGDVVDGSEDPDNTEQDILDLTSFGFSRTQIDYDPSNPENGVVTFYELDGVTPAGQLSFTNIEKVIACFTPGTRITTLLGEVAVETLQPGDMVLTRDKGYLALSWVGRRDLTAQDLADTPAYAPIRIAKGALGQGAPERDMIVSPQHRMLMTGPRAQLFFAENEVLVPAVHMVNWPGVSRVLTQDPVSYLHVMFEDHQIICADGAWTESFQPGLASLSGMDDAQRQELLTLFPSLPTPKAYPAARMTLKAHESRLLMPV